MQKVAILLSSYNGEKYIREQIDSIIRQEGVDWQLLCRDDGSSDATADIIREYIGRHPDRIALMSAGPNLGFARSFETLMEEACRRYPDIELFAFADQDDVWKPEKIRVAAEYILKEDASRPVLYCSKPEIVDRDLNLLRIPADVRPAQCTKSRALIRNIAPGCTMVFNRSALELYLNNPVADNKLHDNLMFQICTFLGSVVYDNTTHILYRQHSANQLGKPGFRGRMKKRMQGHYKDRRIETADRGFLQAFGSQLSVDDIRLIRSLVDYRKSIFRRIRLILSPRFKYQSLEKDLFFVLKVILGTL